MKRNLWLPLALMCFAPALAQKQEATPSGDPARRLLGALEVGVQLSDLALEKVQNPKLHDFAVQAQAQYASLLDALGPLEVKALKKVQKARQKSMEKLAALEPSAEVDRRFYKAFGALQTGLLTHVRSGLNTATDPALKALLEQQLPALESQQDALKALALRKGK